MARLAKVRVYLLAITLGAIFLVVMTFAIIAQQRPSEQGETDFMQNNRSKIEENSDMQYTSGKARFGFTLLNGAGISKLVLVDHVDNTTEIANNTTAVNITSNTSSKDDDEKKANGTTHIEENQSSKKMESTPMISASCGQGLTANTILSNDLECVGTGLIVERDGITIHLNGKKLSLSNSSASLPKMPELENIGILVGNHRNVSIVGPGVIAGFDKAIEFAGSDVGLISDVKLTKNKVGVLIKASDEVTINSTSLDGNTVGIGTQSSNGGKILFNQIVQNGEQGILVLDSNHITISGNSVLNNGQNGVFLDIHSSNNTLSLNNLLNQTIDVNNADGVPIDIVGNKFIENSCRKTLPDGLC